MRQQWSAFITMSTGVFKMLIPGNWYIKVICKHSQNIAVCETTYVYIYSCAKTPVFVLPVEFRNWVWDRVCSGKVSSLLTYFTHEIM
jgi:hypothetical protein